MSFVVFDIETGPLPREDILAISPSHPPLVELGEFNPSTVKLGNLKDKLKIAEKVSAAREKHESAAASQHADHEKSVADYEAKLLDRAALDAHTCEILAIGVMSERGQKICEGTEEFMLRQFWGMVRNLLNEKRKIVGHHCKGFDLPIMIRRSMLYGLAPPTGLLDWRGYWSQQVVDLNDIWACGSRSMRVSLDTLAKFFGVGGKPEGVSGKDFARLFREDRDAAMAYLMNDLDMTFKVATAMRAGE